MEIPSAPQTKLRTEQKVGFVLLLIFGVIAIALGGLQLRNTIYGPFVIELDNSEQADIERLFSDEESRLQQIDTDNDGLNDFEELSFYETSPYLPDSDSDGIDDAEEVAAGTDPNCPIGQDCANAEHVPEKEKPEVSPLLNIQAPEEGQPVDFFSQLGASEGQDIGQIIKDPTVLRDVLLKTGQISKEQLDLIDDAALLEMAEELYAKTNTAPEDIQPQEASSTSTISQ